MFPELASSPIVMTNAKVSALPRLTGVGGGACLPVARYCARVDSSLLLLNYYQALILRKSAHIPYIVATSCVTYTLERAHTGAEDFLLHSITDISSCDWAVASPIMGLARRRRRATSATRWRSGR